MNHSASWY